MHLFCNMSGSDSDMEQTSSVSPLHLMVHLALVIMPQCLLYVVFYVLKHQEPKSWGLLFIPLIFVELFSHKKDCPALRRGNRIGVTQLDSCWFSLIFLGKVSRWCLYSWWGKLKLPPEPQIMGCLESLTVLCSPLQTPTALQISLWGLKALFPNLRVDKLLIEGAFPHRFLY